jgi:hypothetical protein
MQTRAAHCYQRCIELSLAAQCAARLHGRAIVTASHGAGGPQVFHATVSVYRLRLVPGDWCNRDFATVDNEACGYLPEHGLKSNVRLTVSVRSSIFLIF